MDELPENQLARVETSWYTPSVSMVYKIRRAYCQG